MATMTAAVFEGEGRLSVRPMPVPEISLPTDVLLRIEATGVCGTDLHILSVPPGHPATPGSILGHEMTGEVLQAGPAAGHLRPGDRVVVDPNILCGTCPYCLGGQPNMCENMTTLGIFLHGGFAPYCIAPAKQCFKVAPHVPATQRFWAELLACVVNGTQKVGVQPGDRVVVLGAGPVGLLFTQIFRAAGAGRIVVSEPSAYRADFARRSGATHVVHPDEVRQAGAGADVVVDSVGTMLPVAVELARRGGQVLLFGMNAHARQTIAQNEITRREITVKGSYIARYTFPAAVKMIEAGVLDLEALITHRVRVEALPATLDALRRGEGIKAVVLPQG